MNLIKLFELQKALDAPYSDVPNRLSKDILWLMEELGELVREWRGHKYRRLHQLPRNYCETCQLTSIPHNCRNPLLEEYTDCLSIILSIGLQLGFDKSKYTACVTYSESITDTFNDTFIAFADFAVEGDEEYYVNAFGYLIALGILFGFTDEQVESNYISKVESNKLRNGVPHDSSSVN